MVLLPQQGKHGVCVCGSVKTKLEDVRVVAQGTKGYSKTTGKQVNKLYLHHLVSVADN